MFFTKCLKKRNGFIFLIPAVLSCILVSLVSLAFADNQDALFVGAEAYETSVQAVQVAQNESKIINVTSYSDLPSLAQPRTAVADTSFEMEVVVGTEIDLGSGNKELPMTINVYKPSETAPRFVLKATPTSQGSGNSVPSGTICLWYGNAASVPTGWVICNGLNGTPDLRNRFVLGAGLDAGSTKVWTSGWGNIGGGFTGVGFTGGEEKHSLTTLELPSFSVPVPGGLYLIGNADGSGASWGPNGGAGLGTISFPVIGGASLWFAGGNQAHNVMPPFIGVYYIMKQ